MYTMNKNLIRNFKMENQQPNDENQISKAKTKEKWTPAVYHHSIETFINLVKKTLMTQKANLKNDQAKFNKRGTGTTKAIKFRLPLNHFTFSSKLYLQIKGCAMGTICGTAYANIFTAYFEEKCIYPVIDAKTLLYLRFIDDMFMIWTKSEKDPNLNFK